jgi:Zn-dependent peptidase ImmA (M78 family)
MSDRFVGPKLSDGEVKRRAEKAASLYFYLNKGRFEAIDILDILEFQLERFAPGFKFIVLEEYEVKKIAETIANDEGQQTFLACTDSGKKTIYVSNSLYKSAYEGDGWSRTCLAHELGHAVLHSDYSNRTPHFAFSYRPSVTSVDESKVRGIPLFRDSERQADLFAAFFLAPDDLVVRSVDSEQLAALACIQLSTSRARWKFHLAEKEGRKSSLSLRPR